MDRAEPHNRIAAGAGIETAMQAGRDIHVHHVPEPRLELLQQTPLPSYRSFENRADELKVLGAFFPGEGDAECVVVIEGPPGVGKRSVVRRFAFLYRDRFPGGDLYVDLADFGANNGVGDIDAVLVDVLSGLGVAPEHAPRSRTALRACYRTRLRSRPGPLLVVIENATEPAQVTALLPGRPDCLVLVTPAPGADLSELDLHDAEFLRLASLDADHSMALFRRASGSLSETSAQLVRLCDGVPFALLVLAKRVARLHTMTEAELAAQIAADGRLFAALKLGGREVMSAALTTAYQALPADLRRAYRRLGLFPGPDLGPGPVAVVLESREAEAARVLDALAGAQLLTRKRPGRYAFANRLIRLHARELAVEEEPAERREAVLARVVEYHLLRAAFADRAKRRDRTRIADHAELLAGHEDPFTGPDPAREAMASLDAERANLVPVVEAAFEAGFLRRTVLLADALTAYFPDRRDLSAWITVGGLGARAAHDLGDPWAEARLRSMLSRPLADRGELERARAEIESAQRLADRTGDLVLRASVWEFAGRFLAGTDPRAALDAYDRSIALNREAGELRGVALSLAFSADTLRGLDETERARRSYEDALALFIELDDARMAARTRIGLALTLPDDAAAGALTAAVQDVAGTHYEAQARTHLADLARRVGDPVAERGHLLRALEIYRDVRHPAADEIAARLVTPASGRPGSGPSRPAPPAG